MPQKRLGGMMEKRIELHGVPIEFGASQRGTVMGPAAMRTAGLGDVLAGLGYQVADLGDALPVAVEPMTQTNPRLRNLNLFAGWTRALEVCAHKSVAGGAFPVFMGGDHALSAGTVAGLARQAKEDGREQFVLWLDAHPDFHTLETTESGNVHGTPTAFFCGLPGFDGLLGAPIAAPVDPRNVCMMGIRSVDPAEHDRLLAHEVIIHDMRRIDERGVAALLAPFLETVARRNGRLHVSLDVDFLDPEIAPAVGTTVPGGATFREAHLIMEMLHDSALVGSLDIVELNPFLDDRGRTARLLVDLVASLFGRRVMDRPTRSRWSV